MEVDGLKELEESFRRKGSRIKPATSRTLQQVAVHGRNLARQLAPNFTGEVAASITHFPQSEEIWIIQSAPAASDMGFPVNVVFDEGAFGNMTMWASEGDPVVGVDRAGNPRTPFRPRNPSVNIGFMKRTAELMEKEFSERLNLEIRRVVESR